MFSYHVCSMLFVFASVSVVVGAVVVQSNGKRSAPLRLPSCDHERDVEGVFFSGNWDRPDDDELYSREKGICVT